MLLSGPGPSIPRILHYVWVGPRPLPEQDRQFIAGWRRMMPGWEIRAWTDQTIEFDSSKWLRRAYAMRSWNRISNFMRMQCVYRHGGIYLDTDFELVRPLDDFLNDGCFLGYQFEAKKPEWDWSQGPHWINAALLGATAGHWFPKAALDWIETNIPGEQSGLGPTGGPSTVTRVLLQAGFPERSDVAVRHRGMTVYPRRYFYPYGPGEQFRPQCVTADTYAVHHWADTWSGSAGNWPLSKKLWRSVVRYSPDWSFHVVRRRVERERKSFLQGAAGARQAGT